MSLWALAPRPFPTLDVAELRTSEKYRRIHTRFLELSVLDTRLDLLAAPEDPVAPGSEDEVEDLGTFEPDPNLIAHAEGNRKWLRYFQEHARRSAAAAKAAARDGA